MAINKAVNKSTKTHRGMMNVLTYVLRDEKIRDRYVDMTGPAPFSADITPETVYDAFMQEKQLWRKDSGRLYAHHIISFAPDEEITPEQAMAFGRDFATQWFPDHQTLIAVHQDKEHTHIHFITNTVSYETGRKLHNSRNDLEQMKQFTNRMCRDYGLTVAQKGKHFDGTAFEEGEITAWSKDAYHLLISEKKSFLAECGIAVLEAKEQCPDKETFIARMKEKGWSTTWDDKRKHITFVNEEGRKVRDRTLSKSFNMTVSKEELLHEFEAENEKRQHTGNIGTGSKVQTSRARKHRTIG